MSENELIEYAISQFKVIVERARKLSIGNVSHNSKHIEGHTQRCYEFLEQHRKN